MHGGILRLLLLFIALHFKLCNLNWSVNIYYKSLITDKKSVNLDSFAILWLHLV